MNFLHKITPRYTPATLAPKGDLVVLREKILQTILLFFTVVGLPLIVLIAVLGTGSETSYIEFIYFGVYALIASMTLARDIPYAVRGHTLTTIVYLIALSQVLETGQMNDTRTFLVAFAALTAVLFGYRTVIAAVAVSLVTIAGIGFYASVTPEPILPVLANLRTGTSWMVIAGTFIIVAGLISGAITFLVAGLGANLKKQAELAQSLEFERDALESRINERTETLARSMNQLRAAADISHAISVLSDPETLLQQVADLIRDRFQLYYVGIFLLDASRQYAVLQAGTGEAGAKMISLGHQLAVGGSSMIGWAVSNRKARIALDVGAEAVRFSNPHLPRTRSEMALPVIAHESVLGAITIQSEQPNAFDENDIAILETVADSLAIALENDRLYHETSQRLEEIRALNHEYLQRVWAETAQAYGDLAYEYENTMVQSQTGRLRQANIIELPLMLRDEVIGTIELEMDRPALDEEEQTFVENVTTQTAIALENARLLQETERRAVQEQKLNQLATRFSRASSIDEIIRAAAQELGQLPSVAEVTVQLQPAAPQSKPATGSLGAGSHAAPRSNGKEHHA